MAGHGLLKQLLHGNEEKFKPSCLPPIVEGPGRKCGGAKELWALEYINCLSAETPTDGLKATWPCQPACVRDDIAV